MDPEQHAFVEDMGQHMVGWGLSRNTGRVYAYLLLRAEPASLDEISAGVGIAKSGVSVVTRRLAQLGLCRAIAERGSRRVLYEALYNLEGIMAARNSSTTDLMRRLRQGAQAAGDGRGRELLTDMAETLQAFVDMAPAVLQQVHEMRERRRQG
jgi:DNA-binding transcriptional regulator GbsR (MarR family)